MTKEQIAGLNQQSSSARNCTNVLVQICLYLLAFYLFLVLYSVVKGLPDTEGSFE